MFFSESFCFPLQKKRNPEVHSKGSPFSDQQLFTQPELFSEKFPEKKKHWLKRWSCYADEIVWNCWYPSSHNHGSGKWVPGRLVQSPKGPFSTSKIMGERESGYITGHYDHGGFWRLQGYCSQYPGLRSVVNPENLWYKLKPICKSTPPKSNIDTKHDGLWKMYLPSNMAILGIYVRFQGGNPSTETNYPHIYHSSNHPHKP